MQSVYQRGNETVGIWNLQPFCLLTFNQFQGLSTYDRHIASILSNSDTFRNNCLFSQEVHIKKYFGS